MFSIEELNDVPVVVARDFLPSSFVTLLYEVIARFQPHFGPPPWSTDPHGTAMDEGKKLSLCLGEDIWFPYKDPSDDEARALVPQLLYDYVEQFVFHQGLMAFFAKSQCEAFRLIPGQSPDGRIHLICYGDGGYYSWHRDLALREGPSLYGHTPPRHNLITFSLCLCRGSPLSGGDLLFMRDNKTAKVDFEHNMLTVFPSTVHHAATEVRFPDELDWLDRRFSLQFWLAGPIALSREVRTTQRWEE